MHVWDDGGGIMPNAPGQVLQEEILKLLNEITEENKQKNQTTQEE